MQDIIHKILKSQDSVGTIICDNEGVVIFSTKLAQKIYPKLKEKQTLQNCLPREEAKVLRSIWSKNEEVRLFEFVEIDNKIFDLLFNQIENYRVISLIPGLNESTLLKAIGETTGKYGHDLNNLLGSIQGATDLINSKLKKLHGDPHPIEKPISLIHSAIQKTVKITAQMRGYARMEAPPKSRIDLLTVLEKLSAELNNGKGSDSTIILNCPSDMIVEAEEFQLYQALSFILGNAQDAISKHQDQSLLVLVDKIQESIKPDNDIRDLAEIVISDHGKGMSEDSIKNALKAFYSEKQTRIGGGLGLGLPMAKQIIEDNGGSLSISSLPDVGTAVRILLPLVEGE
jgi:signal transduction histidine kinase